MRESMQTRALRRQRRDRNQRVIWFLTDVLALALLAIILAGSLIALTWAITSA